MENQPKNRTKAQKAPPPGFPGHRTQPGRSGLDYIDNAREFSFMEGKLIRGLFTGRLRTRNPIYQVVLLLLGLALLLPAVALFGESAAGRLTTELLCFPLALFVFGAAFLYNAVQSIWLGGSAFSGADEEERLSGAPVRLKRPVRRRKIRYNDRREDRDD